MPSFPTKGQPVQFNPFSIGYPVAKLIHLPSSAFCFDGADPYRSMICHGDISQCPSTWEIRIRCQLQTQDWCRFTCECFPSLQADVLHCETFVTCMSLGLMNRSIYSGSKSVLMKESKYNKPITFWSLLKPYRNSRQQEQNDAMHNANHAYIWNIMKYLIEIAGV